MSRLASANTWIVSTLHITGVYRGALLTLGREEAGDQMDRAWTTGFFKEPVEGAVPVGEDGVAGDHQADRVNHGGPDKAICCYPSGRTSRHQVYWRRISASGTSSGSMGLNYRFPNHVNPAGSSLAVGVFMI
jgi:hypothetical protein